MFIANYIDMKKLLPTAKIARLFKAVEDNGGTIRFVGGAVRDTIAGISGFDIDLATDLSPDELVEACQSRRIKTVPLGLKTDSVGVLIDNQIFEVSSLRRSLQKNSAHTDFQYTDDWSADASKRDLTINAVYADLQGNVFDYYNGITDLLNGTVRFIGSAEERIKEDYLRIMRFFRFYSIFSKTPINKEALQACIKLKDGLRNLPIERVRDELFKLLTTPQVAETMKIIYDNDILGYFLPKSEHLDALRRLAKLVKDAEYEGNFLRRLFVLYQPNASQAENIANTLRFTKKQKEMFSRWAKIELTAENIATASARAKFIYRYGKQFTIDKILLTAAVSQQLSMNINDVLKETENMIVPIFPLRGKDIVNKGVKDDAEIGKTLNMLEQMWTDSDFSLTRDELLKQNIKSRRQK